MQTQLEALLKEEKVYISDENDTLKVYNYSDDQNREDLRRYRGLIVDMKGDVVCESYGYTPEYTDLDDLDSLLLNFKDYKVVDSHEGCLLRLFYYGDKWYLSTHKKLDAFTSKWSSKTSFGDNFVRALVLENKENSQFKSFLECEDDSKIYETFLDKLDTKIQYFFLVKNTTENRIVCNSDYTPGFLYVGSKRVDSNTIEYSHLPVTLLPLEHTFKSVERLREYVVNCNYKDLQGVILLRNLSAIKVLNSKYKSLFDVRGNVASVAFRYLQVRTDPEIVKRLLELYPEKAQLFQSYEERLLKSAVVIHKAYINRYINKQYAVVSKEEYRVLSKCHQSYLANRTHIVTLAKVLDVLSQEPAPILNKIVKKYK
jgi:hypothetical protein